MILQMKRKNGWKRINTCGDGKRRSVRKSEAIKEWSRLLTISSSNGEKRKTESETINGSGSAATSNDPEFVEQDIESPAVSIDLIDAKSYHTELIPVTLEAMQVIDNGIRGIDDSHLSSILKTF